ncbi:transporter substrate-binding domain-containing protein [Streptomyces sp. NPDC057499]|uniref:caspase, EACC1-associated type n=1 Tax=Streptomyces sp. NPDC057499 TaxID=3346150 RepID=UPI00369343D7
MSTSKQHAATEDRELMAALMGMSLPDPAGSRVVLVGAGRFSELDPLPATRRNVKALADLLIDAWSLPDENCTVLCDPRTPRDLSRAVEAAAREATDTLLVYYAGHGVIDRAGHYHLAVRNTERDSVHDTAVPYEWIKAHVEKSRAERRIVILDCCYAARAFGLQSNAAALEVAGTYILAAAGETAMAISPPGETFTAFTEALLSVLGNGIPGLPRYLDLDRVFSQLSKELAKRDRPRPAQLCRDNLGRAPFIKNAAYDPPIESPQPKPPAQRTQNSESGKEEGQSAATPAPAAAEADGPLDPSTRHPSKKRVPLLRRKAVRYAGLPTIVLALLFGGWSAYAVASVSYKDSPRVQKIRDARENKITIGVKDDQPGFAEYVDGKWVGFEIDLGRKVAANLGFTQKNQVNFTNVDTGNRVRPLQTGSVDLVIATWSMNGDQARKAGADKEGPIDFVGPYFTASLGALVWGTDGEVEGLENIRDIARTYKKEGDICTASGSTSEAYLKQNRVKYTPQTSYQGCWNVSNVVVTDDIILAGINDAHPVYGREGDKGHVISLQGTAEKYGVGILAGDPILKYLTCRALQKGWKESVGKNLKGKATRQLRENWTPPVVDFPECSRLDVWKYKLRHPF